MYQQDQVRELDTKSAEFMHDVNLCTLTAGVYLSLRGVAIANNSYVNIDSIGSDDASALLCHTDKTDCCNATLSPNGTTEGNWYYTNGDAVGTHDENEGSALTMDDMSATSFTVNRGPSEVRLLLANSPQEGGNFYCEVPDADDISQMLYVNICELQAKL